MITPLLTFEDCATPKDAELKLRRFLEAIRADLARKDLTDALTMDIGDDRMLDVDVLDDRIADADATNARTIESAVAFFRSLVKAN